ncbi:MAG: glutathione-regulated potassium-efflux system protein KefC [Rhodospirillales bacterium]|nr:MAG: glutathione-regulated potassium-efflux system protein KefC [Rhodospirillales bacterium]
MSILGLATVLMAAAVIAVPISKRLGLGSVLGYLAAGAMLGPFGAGLIRDVDDILHFAELGVVLLLFIIGLELQPSRLWTMRRPVFGLGGAQVVLTALLLGLAAWLFGLPAGTATIVGLALALSSTAFALQILAERNELTSQHGRAAFSILLFQDIAVIPILAMLPLLAVREGAAMDAASLLAATAKVVAVLAAVVVGGRYLLRPVFRLVAATGIREVFTAMALLIVVGTALLMEAVGLSMALGAFLAGVLLADSEYRHALEADIEPFKGLLLGLFFIAVGMSVNLGLLLREPLTVAAIVVGLMVIKIAVLYVLGTVYSKRRATARQLALFISQGGEFAFVIFGFATGLGVVERDLVALLILAVTMSMVATPLLLALHDVVLRRFRESPAEEDFEMPEPAENKVIIAGFGRFGQIVGRMLRARKIGFTALEASSDQVDFVRKFGNKVYYGDPSRLELLRAAKAEAAKIFVLAVDDIDASVRTVETVKRHFPHLKIYARARNRSHAYQLMELGVDVIQRETFLSSLDIGRQVLEGVGFSASEAARTTEMFRDHDVRRLKAHFGEHRDEKKMMRLASEWARELEELFEEDAAEEAAE